MRQLLGHDVLLPLLLVATTFAFVAAAAASQTVTKPNDVIVGARLPGDRLIQRQAVAKDASVIGLKVSVSRTFEGDGVSNITQIRALDQHTNGHGATAVFLAGGVRFNYVTIYFESERFRAIDFVVEIYGK